MFDAGCRIIVRMIYCQKMKINRMFDAVGSIDLGNGPLINFREQNKKLD